MNKLFKKIATLSVGLAMAIGVGVAVGKNSKVLGVSAAPGSTLKTYDTTSSTFTTGYKRQSGDNFIWFGQKGFFGANNATNHGNFKPTAADLPVVKAHNSSATTSTTGLYYCYTSEAVANVGSMSIYLSAKSGSSTVNAYVVSSSTAASSGSANWTKVTLSSTSTSAQGANVATAATYTFTFNATETSSKYYGFVFSTSSYWRATNFNMKLIEGTIPASGISLNKTSTTIAPGSSETLTATVTPSNATDKTVSWSVSPTGQGVTVSNGVVSATAAATPGEYTVTASANGGTNVKATCTVTVQSAAAESITVAGTSSVYVGDAGLSLTATPSNFSPSSYTWTSSKTGVATVSGTGSTCSISALAKGTTDITASATGSSGTVTSNVFTLTVKQFSIALSTSSVSLKASKSTTVTVTPTDATGTVVVTAISNNTSVATTSVSGTTITINSGSEGGVSTTITVSAKDNNGASGYHTAANQTISVEVTAGYVVGNKITALPSSDKYVFLGNAAKTSWVGGTGTDLPQTTNGDNAAIFILSTTGTLNYYNQDAGTTGNYIYGTNGGTSVSYSTSSCAWDQGLDDSDYPGMLKISGDKGRFLMFNSNIVKCYAYSNAEAQASNIIYAYEAIPVTPTAVLNKDSVSGLKGNSDNSLTLTISNFTPTGLNVTYKDSGESSFSSSSSVASVTCGHASGSNAVSTSFIGVGSTTVKLSVTRGNGDPIEATFTVTVAAKPASMTIVHSDISEGHLEIETSKYKDVSFSGQDTDGNAYAIYAADVTASVQSGASYVSVSGTRIIGTAVGSGVVRYTLKALTSIYAEVTVDVRDNYKTTVNTITVIDNAEVYQGDALDVSKHISVKTANTHFGPTTDIVDSELLFSYTNTRASGVIYSSFVYEVEDTTLDAGETETRTIYVFTTFDENYSGSFTAVIEAIDRPVVGLLVDGESVNPGDSILLSIPRNSTYNLGERVTVDPTNATESHQIDYAITSGANIISISAAGIITVGSKTGNAIVSATSHANSDYYVYFVITITREAMTITADVPTTGWALATSLEVGDEVVMVNQGDNMELSGVTGSSDSPSNIGTATSYSGAPARTLVLTVGEGVDGGFTFSYNGNYLAYTNETTSSNNKLYTISSLSTSDEKKQASWVVTFDGTVAQLHNVYNSSRYLRYNANSGQERFCAYTGNQQDVSFYKEQSGTVPQEVTVTDALFNIINNAMSLKTGSTTLYDLGLCDATGTSFNTSAWTALGNQFTAAIKSDNKLAFARADENGNEIEQFLVVYDYVVRKYGETYDFLGRVASGKITLSGRISPYVNILGGNPNAAAIVIITSVISVAAVGGYFFLRKKKED